MSETMRQLRGALPLLIVLAIVLTFVVFFLRRTGVFSETVTLRADQIGLAPTPTGESDPASEGTTAPADDVTLEIVTLLPKDAIPAIFDPSFVTAVEADEFLRPEDLVMGVEFGGETRAYGVPFLSSHEVVNDVVGGRAITVTW